MDESLQDLPKLFVYKMIKYWMFEYIKFMSQLSNYVKWNKSSDDMESMLIAPIDGTDILISVTDFVW